MIRQLSVRGFTAVPYLEGSRLMQSHPSGITFAQDKPTVLVGPNGSGKSALLTTLAIRHLAYFTGESTFDRHYVDDFGDSKAWWTCTHAWRRDYRFLQGLTCDTDNGPVLYYRPRHVPGNEASGTHALMMGYATEARAYMSATDRRSSGEGNRARLERTLSVLQGAIGLSYAQRDWRYGFEARDLSLRREWIGEDTYKAEVLKELYSTQSPLNTVLLDEPEQSLDAVEDIKLWKSIETSSAQVIVATHSLYPLLHADRFQMIETVPGYVERVLQLVR